MVIGLIDHFEQSPMITLESIPVPPDRGYAVGKLLRAAEDRERLTLKGETHLGEMVVFLDVGQGIYFVPSTYGWPNSTIIARYFSPIENRSICDPRD